MSRSSGRTSATRTRPYAQARATDGRPPGRDTPPRRRLVSLADAAAHADVSTRTLRRYIAHGRLTGYRVGPRLVKVDLNEVDRLARPIPASSHGVSPLGYRRGS